MLAKYRKLTEVEIKTLVVEDKWFTSIQSAVHGEVHRLIHHLATRVRELEERYAQPLPELEHEVKEYAVKVGDHLKKMGLIWK